MARILNLHPILNQDDQQASALTQFGIARPMVVIWIKHGCAGVVHKYKTGPTSLCAVREVGCHRLGLVAVGGVGDHVQHLGCVVDEPLQMGVHLSSVQEDRSFVPVNIRKSGNGIWK